MSHDRNMFLHALSKRFNHALSKPVFLRKKEPRLSQTLEAMFSLAPSHPPRPLPAAGGRTPRCLPGKWAAPRVFIVGR